MISITSAQIDVWMATLLFPLARILGLISSAPVLGNKQVPRRVKVGLAIFITLVIAPTLGDMPAVQVGSPQGILIIIQQAIIGIAMGFTIRIIFTAIEMAGELIGLQMGLGFASFFDPINSGYSPIVARWLGMIATLAFLAMNGHLTMLAALVESFHVLPVGNSLPLEGYRTVANWGGSIFIYGLQLSMPILAALLITNIALGILTRAAPQLNLFAVGFPITLGLGFIVLSFSIHYIVPLLDRLVQEGVATSLRILVAH